MAARPPIFTAQGFYHVYNRGHNKQTIFYDARDYRRYLKRLGEYLIKHEVTLLAYCLMPNHVHLLLRQDGEEPMDRFIHRLHTAYTMYFNIKYERLGSVFQGRFKAKLIDTDEYLLHVSRYIHINPIEIVQDYAQGPALSVELGKFPWSSYGEYLKQRSENLCNTEIIRNYFSNSPLQGKTTYRLFVEEYLGISTPERLAEISGGNL
ncbi:MAG: transposase [Patescibacteria group bacterium]|mgnify:CR=1 FL=1